MQNIIVGRYTDGYAEGVEPVAVDNGVGEYAGWIEPEDRSWVLFVRADHSVEVYLDRDPVTGAVL
jgi:hypothetical protein